MVDYATMRLLQNNLPETLEGNEKIDRLKPKAFFEQNHSKEIKSTAILIPLITKNIRKNYVRFLQII
jgi:5-bromo-4-chloroindolyl phosphate hydrolysis protein